MITFVTPPPSLETFHGYFSSHETPRDVYAYIEYRELFDRRGLAN